MRIDIIIVSYNAKKNIKRCVNSIRKHTRDCPYRLTIVDNNSTDGTVELLKTLGSDIKIIINKENLGFSGGANTAIKSTSGAYMALVDDDAEVTPHWLKKLHKKIRESPDIGIVGCKIVFPNNLIFCAEIGVSTGCPTSVGYGEADRGQRDYIKEVESVNGACWIMRREVFKKVGFYDTQFFPCQYEDLDYCLRARQAGFKVIYDGQVPIIHHHLFRDGGIRTNFSNHKKFMTKWDGLKSFREGKGSVNGQPRNPSNRIKGLLSAALKSKRKGDYQAAIKYLEEALLLNPYMYSAHYQLAVIYKKIGRIADAREEGIKFLGIFELINYHKAGNK